MPLPEAVALEDGVAELVEVLVWVAEPKRPEKVKSVLSKPARSVAAVVLLLVTSPVPVREPIAEPTPLRSTVPRAPTSILEFKEKALATEERTTPSETLKVPLKLLAGFAKRRMPAPDFVRAKAPP